MTETAALVALLRRRGAEPSTVEVKSGVGGVPKSLRETLSAFSNGRGGTVLLGLDEASGFALVDGFDARRVRDGVAGMCSNDMTPPVRADIEIEELEHGFVVRVDVPELASTAKPCFITLRGTYGGSYVRSADGDYRLSEYEITQLLANRSQPVDDRSPVPGATADDLDPQAVARLLDRVRGLQPLAFAAVPDDQALERLGVLVWADGRLVPSVAGLLCLGQHPQQFLPQLDVTFVVIPGVAMGDATSEGQRFLDNRTIDGPVPQMVSETVAAVTRSMARQAVVTGVGRRDVYDYPVEVVRELVVNAVMHRDYSNLAKGTQAQVELYVDRLVIKSPGGLYGTVDTALFGADDVSSSRNATLARLLADVEMPGGAGVVSENRGSGIPRVLRVLREAGMSPPLFDASLSQVRVTIPRHALLDASTLDWIAGLGLLALSDAQSMVLAMVRTGREISNENLRGWGFDRATASRALSGLVQLGAIERAGGRRYATYHLAADPGTGQLELEPTGTRGTPVTAPSTTGTERARVLNLAARDGNTTTKAVMAELRRAYPVALRRINELVEAGLLEPTAPPTSRKRAYRITERGLRMARMDTSGAGPSTGSSR